MKVIDAARLAELNEAAQAAPRKRAHVNLHDELSDPIQRVVIAMEPETYVCPHRHADGIWEMFAVLKGSCALLTFDEDGAVAERVELRPDGAVISQVQPGAWHSVVALEPGTVAFEVKPGPYRALTDKQFATWAPKEGEPGTEAMREWFKAARPGERAPSR